MAVKIRLSRIGTKHVPFYRIVAVDERKKRDGAFLEDLGTYDAVNSRLIKFNDERINYWISVGAVPTDTVKKLKKLYAKIGLSQPVEPKKVAPKKPAPKVVAKEEVAEVVQEEPVVEEKKVEVEEEVKAEPEEAASA